MDCPDYITVEPERKPGQHLQREDRGAIQRLRRLGYSNRAIVFTASIGRFSAF